MRGFLEQHREMLGNERGVDPPGKFGETPQVARVEPFGAAERERNAVQRDRIVAADRFQVGERLSPPPLSFPLVPPPPPAGARAPPPAGEGEGEPPPRPPRGHPPLLPPPPPRHAPL